MSKFKTREEWLQAMTAALRPKFKAAGLVIPTKIHVSCAFPSEGALANKSQRIGECWEASASGDGHWEIMISPILREPVRVAGVLVHELLHAALESANPDKDISHGPAFKAAMPKLGLNGKPTATGESAELKRELTSMIRKVGKYPHAGLTFKRKGKVQSTRLHKVACVECGYTIRVTSKWIEIGLPTCCCGSGMEAA